MGFVSFFFHSLLNFLKNEIEVNLKFRKEYIEVRQTSDGDFLELQACLNEKKKEAIWSLYKS